MKNKFESIFREKDKSPEDVVKTLTETILNCASQSGISTQKIKLKNTNQPPWFTRECTKLKNKIRGLAKKLKSSPNDSVLRESLFATKKKFSNLIRKNKLEYKQSLIEKMHFSNKSDPKKFWKLLDKLAPQMDVNTNINGTKWVNHFKSLLQNKNGTENIPISSEAGPLDHEITAKEISDASGILKQGKAPGLDNVLNEMISCSVNHYPHVFLFLFNLILKSGGHIPSWAVSLLVPIYKKGDQSDPSNYRGISLISCIAKLFLCILNKRLLSYCIQNNILAPNQLGFLPGNRTSDAHIILYNLINKYCHQKKMFIYGCFVDFSKAFDSISREKLFKKLRDYGITGKVYNVILNLYNNDRACVRVGDKMTEEFEIERGVRQGCILSPLLFNIFMADVSKRLGEENGVYLDKDAKTSAMIWADDIILLSETEKGLQDLLNKLSEYCEENELTINIDKTKIMIFNKTGRLIRRDFFMDNEKIENVREYKYLGLLFTPSGEIKSALDDLRARALKAYWGLKGKLGTFFSKHVIETMHLFDTLVRPILTYASDFWGCLKVPNNNPIENVHTMFCKHLLGVNKSTTNYGVWLELGRIPLMIFAKKAAVKNWERIRRGVANSYLKLSYKNAKDDSLLWLSGIESTLTSIGLGNLFSDNTNAITRHSPAILYQRLMDVFHQDALSSINKQNGKLRTYGLIKGPIGFESYLINVNNLKHRKSLSQLRLSSHRLMIETGRHNKTMASERLCPFCKTVVEDEIHFVTQCKIYDILRKPLYEVCLNLRQNFDHYSDKEKFIFIFTTEHLQNILAKYAFLAEELRSFLVQNHKNID